MNEPDCLFGLVVAAALTVLLFLVVMAGTEPAPRNLYDQLATKNTKPSGVNWR